MAGFNLRQQGVTSPVRYWRAIEQKDWFKQRMRLGWVDTSWIGFLQPMALREFRSVHYRELIFADVSVQKNKIELSWGSKFAGLKPA